MNKIFLAIAAVAALSGPAFAQATQYDNGTVVPPGAEMRATAPGYGGYAEPRNGYGTFDDNKQSATGGESGGSAERGR